MRLAVLWCVVLASVGVAAPVPKAAKKPSADGRWEIVELYVGKQDVTKLNPWVWEIKGDELTIHRRRDGTLQLDDPNTTTTLVPTDKPGEIDYKRVSATNTVLLKSLLRVTDDELLLCVSEQNGGARPTELKVNDGVMFLRFKRATDK